MRARERRPVSGIVETLLPMLRMAMILRPADYGHAMGRAADIVIRSDENRRLTLGSELPATLQRVIATGRACRQGPYCSGGSVSI